MTTAAPPAAISMNPLVGVTHRHPSI